MKSKAIAADEVAEARITSRRSARNAADRARRAADLRVGALGTPEGEAARLSEQLRAVLDLVAPAIRADALELNEPVDAEALLRLGRLIDWMEVATARFRRELDTLTTAAAERGTR